ncbi:MAG: hypothetical protein R3B70_15355 [Polyangiaceae bacterium]
MVEVNVSADSTESVIAVLPCMREGRRSQLHGEGGYAVRAAVPAGICRASSSRSSGAAAAASSS